MDFQRDIRRVIRFFIFVGLIALASGCTRTLDQCGGPKLNLSQISQLRKTLFSSGPMAALVVPNPMDATGNPAVLATDTRLSQFDYGFNLPDLLNPNRLESAFLKIRISSISDAASLLAVAGSNGFAFSVTDVHYSETMAYYAVTSIMKYVQALGFSYNQTRPVYVLAQTTEQGHDANYVNAYFENNTLDPSQPRVMRMIGKTDFSPGQDRDMYWHETGHFANESVSHEIGIDRAGEEGAFYTDGAAIHECMADIIAESLANKGYIGKWINRNFTKDGSALRSAMDTASNKMTYSQVMNQDNTGTYPERYKVAEWCTRALWQIRQQFVKEDPNAGQVFSDRLFLSAVSLLPKDASMAQFHEALVSADEQLHCGLHANSIDNAFTSRGFEISPSKLKTGLTIQAQAVGEDSSGNQTALSSGGTVAFALTVTNPNSETAHNVRVVLESQSAGFQVITYLQGYGDLPAGKSAIVGNGSLPLSFSVSGQIDSSVPTGIGQIHYRLRVLSDNAPEVDKDGTL